MCYVYYSQPIIQSGMENPDQVFSCWPKLRKIFFTCGRYVNPCPLMLNFMYNFKHIATVHVQLEI